jgi:hypothetical protein
MSEILLIAIVIVAIIYLINNYNNTTPYIVVKRASEACNHANKTGSEADHKMARRAIASATDFINKKIEPYHGVNVPKKLTDALSTLNNLNCVVLYGTPTPGKADSKNTNTASTASTSSTASTASTENVKTDPVTNSTASLNNTTAPDKASPTVEHVDQAIASMQTAMDTGSPGDMQSADNAINFAQILLNNTVAAYKTANLKIPIDLLEIQRTFNQFVADFKTNIKTISSSVEAANEAIAATQKSLALADQALNVIRNTVSKIMTGRAASFKVHRTHSRGMMGFAVTPITLTQSTMSTQADIDLKNAVKVITSTLIQIQGAIDLCKKVTSIYENNSTIIQKDEVYNNMNAQIGNLTGSQSTINNILAQIGSMAIVANTQFPIAQQACNTALSSGKSTDYQAALRIINSVYNIIATGMADNPSADDVKAFTTIQNSLDNLACTALYGTGTGQLPTTVPTKEIIDPKSVSPNITPAYTVYNAVQAALNARAYANIASGTLSQDDFVNATKAYDLANTIITGTISSLNGLGVTVQPDDLKNAQDMSTTANRTNISTQINFSNTAALASVRDTNLSIANAISLINLVNVDLGRLSYDTLPADANGIYYIDSSGKTTRVTLPGFISDAVQVISTADPISFLGVTTDNVRVPLKNVLPSTIVPIYSDQSKPITGMLFKPQGFYKIRSIAGPTANDLGWCLYNSKYDQALKTGDNSTWMNGLNCDAISMVSYAIIPLPASVTSASAATSVIPSGTFLIGDNSTGLFLAADTYNNTISWNPLTSRQWGNITTLTGGVLAQFAWKAVPASTATDSPIMLQSVAFAGMCFTYDKARGHIEKCSGSMGNIGQALKYSVDGNNWIGYNNTGSVIGPF